MNLQDKKRHGTTVAVLMEDGATAAILLERLSETFNKNARVIKISSYDIRRKNILDQTDILFIPGVQRASDAYRNNLAEEGGRMIKDWVRKGGTVVGLCQGGYLLTETFQYADKYSGRTRIIHPSTGIFEGVAYGPIPLYTHKDDLHNPFIDHAVARLAFNDAAKGASCYAHGPYLELSPQANKREYKVLARFDDVPGKPIAMALRRYGKGKAIFSGVVPEVSGVEMAKAGKVMTPKHGNPLHWETVMNFSRRLADHEAQRQLTWNRLIAEIKPA